MQAEDSNNRIRDVLRMNFSSLKVRGRIIHTYQFSTITVTSAQSLGYEDIEEMVEELNRHQDHRKWEEALVVLYLGKKRVNRLQLHRNHRLPATNQTALQQHQGTLPTY